MKIFKSLLIFLMLTLLSQIGGFVFLVYEFVHPSFSKKIKTKTIRWFSTGAFFILLYCLTTLLIIPPIAKVFGRVPLPFLLEKNEFLKPAKLFYGFANRHYVKPELKEEILKIAEAFCKNSKVEYLTYLDANFPFIDGYPLHPHLSHDDGEKIDLSFIFEDKHGNLLPASPSMLGYGYVAEAKKGETNKAAECDKLNKYYSVLYKITSQNKAAAFNNSANRELLKRICKSPLVKKVFIEPHLKTRLRLNSESKVKFHGCQAVRHDDHIHIQM